MAQRDQRLPVVGAQINRTFQWRNGSLGLAQIHQGPAKKPQRSRIRAWIGDRPFNQPPRRVRRTQQNQCPAQGQHGLTLGGIWRLAVRPLGHTARHQFTRRILAPGPL